MKSRIGSLRARLFWAFALITVLAVALPALFYRNAMYQERIDSAGQQALAHAVFARGVLDAGPAKEQADSLFSSASSLPFRMTLTDPSGKVLRDSHVGDDYLSNLDNHLDRPEIEKARATGSGISLRHSNSLGNDAVYAAVLLKDGGLLRVALPLLDIRAGLQKEILALFAVVASVAGLCLFLSVIVTGMVRRRMDGMAEVVGSIARDKGHRRLRDARWKELQPLALAVNYMADTIEEYVSTMTDQQSQLNAILDSMHEGVLVLGPSGMIRRWNMSMALLFPDIAKAEGKPLIEGIPHPALQARVDAMLTQTEDAVPGQAVHFEMPSGRFLVAHVSPPSSRNDSLGAVIVVYDATEIMRLETVRRDFVSNVSHELRTPLTAIAGYAETLLNSGDLSDEYRNFAGVIHKHANALAGTVTDLLALARVEDTKENIPLATVDILPVIKEALTAVERQAEAKGVGFRLEVAPVSVLGNEALLTQVFRNLLENACRYSPAGGIIHIGAKQDGASAVFIISDDGPGIPPQALSRIFERFYQIKKERNSGTSGIGLAICKHIIERHNGRIWAESPYGAAATAMLVALPATGRDKAADVRDKKGSRNSS